MRLFLNLLRFPIFLLCGIIGIILADLYIFPIHEHFPRIGLWVLGLLSLGIAWYSFRLALTLRLLPRISFLILSLSSLTRVALDFTVSAFSIDESSRMLFFAVNVLYNSYDLLNFVGLLLLILTLLQHKNYFKFVSILIPLILIVGFSVETISIEYKWGIDSGPFAVQNIIFTQSYFLVFLISVLLLSLCKNVSFSLFCVGILFFINANVPSGYTEYIKIYHSFNLDSLRYPTIMGWWGKALIFSSLRYLSLQKDNKFTAWFYPVNSVHAQLTLWGNATPFFLFFLITIYNLIKIKTSTLTQQVFFNNLSLFLPFSMTISILNAAVFRVLMRPLNDLMGLIKNFSPSRINEIVEKKSITQLLEFKVLENKLIHSFEKIHHFTQQEHQLFDLAAKASHDIRSPLSVLNMIFSQSINKFDEKENRMVKNSINRISSAIEDLMKKYRSISINAIEEKQETHLMLLSEVVQDIILEKQHQYQQIKIFLEMSNDARCVFLKIPTNEVARILSNLINNSVEALLGQKGYVLCNVYLKKKKLPYVIIEIKDDGCGMSSSQVAEILSHKKKTTKETGSAIGFQSALERVESWGGKIQVDSQLGQGTTVSIEIPISDQPDWAVSEIMLLPGQQVTILDDELITHQQWDERFHDFVIRDQRILIKHCYTERQLEEEILKNGKNVIYLIDFYMEGENKNGIQVILDHNLISSAILVTNQYSDSNLQSLCASMRIRLLPKNLIPYVKISLPVVRSL